MHSHLVTEPVVRRARRSHVIAAAELVLMRNGVDDRIEAIHISADAGRFLLNAGINLGNGFDLGIHGLGGLIDFVQEFGEGVDPKIHPLAKIGIVEIANL